MHLGDRYQSYSKLETIFLNYCNTTKTRYYKRDCRTIQYKLDAHIKTSAFYLNPKLIYSKIKFVCVHSNDGKARKHRGNKIRHRVSVKAQECPAYLYFRATTCGKYLELVAMNTRHNHQDTHKPISKRKEIEPVDILPVIKLNNVEIEEIACDDMDLNYMLTDEDEMGSSDEVIRLTFGGDTSNDYTRHDLNPLETDEMASLSEESICANSTIYDNHIKSEAQEVSLNYSGMLAPVFTPFKNDAKMSLNMDIIPKYAKYLSDKGIRGVLVNGTSGEGTSMSVYERKIVVEKWITTAIDYQLHVMVQVGGAPLPDVLELAAHAEKFGAHSILCLPELYMKPTTNRHLINYLKLVSEAAPQTPLLYYHIPMFSSVTLHMGKFLNEISNEIPTFSGIKFTSNALDEGIDAVKANNGRFEIFLGSDKLMLGAYALGFKSSIATTLNIFPQLGLKIWENFSNEEYNYAKESQENLSAIVDIITKYGDWVSTMKKSMNMLSPLDFGPVRQPLPGITEKDAAEMDSLLENYKSLL